MIHLPAAEEHRAPADAFKLVRDFEVFEEIIARQDLFEEGAQLRNIPLAVAQIIHQAMLRRRAGDMEVLAERFVRALHAQLRIKNEKWWDGFNDRLRVLVRLSRRGLALAQRANVH